MLHTVAQLIDSHVEVCERAVGRVLDAYFDERSWQIRFLLIEVTDTEGDRALIFPAEAVRRIDQERGRILIDRLPAFDLAAAERLGTLRSSRAVLDCAVAGWTGEIGHTQDALFEADSWVLRFLIIDASNWCPGGVIFIQPALIQTAHWDRQSLHIAVTHVEVLGMPEDDVDAAEAQSKSRVFH